MNTSLRVQLATLIKNNGCEGRYPRNEFCTDNVATIAYASIQRLKAGQFETLAIKAKSNWPLDAFKSGLA